MSRDGHTVRPGPLRVVHRGSRSRCATGARSARTRRYLGIGRDHPRGGCGHPARPLPFARPWNPSPGRAPPSSANPIVVDTAIALFLFALSLLAYVGAAPYIGPLSGVTLAFLPLESLPLIVRRRFPLAVLGVVAGASIVHLALLPAGQSPTAGLGILVAVYTVGERLDRRTSLTATAVTAALLAIVFVGRAGIAEVALSLIQTELIFVVAWLLGDATRIRRLYAGTLEERAQRLERERDERAERAVREERERIARELHDVVTHHVSVMVIQAGGALRVIEKRPDEARTALEAIASTGRLALTDMRRMLGILGEQETAEPTPGLDRLDELVDQLRSAGLAVELVVTGSARAARPGPRGLRLPDHPGGPDELAQARRRRPGARPRSAYAADALEIDDRGRARPGRRRAARRAAPRGSRAHRHARAGDDAPRDVPRPADARPGSVVTARLPVDGAASAA